MKKILFAAAALLLITATGIAQMDSTMVDRRLDRMKTDLSLTADQAAKIRVIMMDSWREGQKLRNANSGDPGAGREAMMKQREASDKKIEAVLTAEQKVKYEKMREERRQRMQQGPPR